MLWIRLFVAESIPGLKLDLTNMEIPAWQIDPRKFRKLCWLMDCNPNHRDNWTNSGTKTKKNNNAENFDCIGNGPLKRSFGRQEILYIFTITGAIKAFCPDKRRGFVP